MEGLGITLLTLLAEGLHESVPCERADEVWSSGYRLIAKAGIQVCCPITERLDKRIFARDRLKGKVEVDETYLAITDREEPISPLGRKNKTTKVLVVLAVELLQPKGFGRIRLRRIDNDSDVCVVPFVQACIEPGAQVRTDGSAAYRSLSGLGYDHQRTVMLGSDVPAHVSMAGVHRVASLVKRWILGTHHGSVQPGHLDAYLDEFVFRFNRRTSSSRGMLFYRLLQQAVVTEPVTYDNIVRPLRKLAK